MKIVEWHVITVAIVMFVTATGLFIYLPFISIKKEPTATIDIEELCRVDVEENKWEYVVLHHSATDEGSADNFDRYHREKKKWEHGLAYHFRNRQRQGFRQW